MATNRTVTGDEVVDINSRVDLDLDATPDENYPPFRIRVGGKEFILDQPDAGLVMELGSAPNTEIALALMFDKQWPDVRDLLAPKAPAALVKLTRDYALHFDIDDVGMQRAAATTREDRRSRPRRRR